MNKNLFFLILLPVLFCTTVIGQKSNKKIVITGIITDAKQNPVERVSIFIDKKSTSSVSDSKGYFKVKVRPTAGMISVMSSVYGVSEAVIDGRTEINFVFTAPVLTSDEALKNAGKNETVNIGYGTQNKNDMGMPVNQIDGRKSKYASYSNIYSMIRSEVPGVTVSGKRITVRGYNSVNLSSAALIIVDGISVTSLDNITPQMVKSIEVLKGASASIYGSRGTNGVILISLIR